MPGEGIDIPICDRCRTKKTHFTCPSCHKYRKPAGLDAKGQIVCKTCLEAPDFLCPTCGKHGIRHSAKKCEDCYWTDHLKQAVVKGCATLPRVWTKAAYQQFGHALIEHYGPQKASHRVSKYLAFFIALDIRYPDFARITTRDLIDSFGKEGLRRNVTAVSFLIKAKYFPESTEWELKHYNDLARQERLLERHKDAWFHPVLIRFRTHALKIQQISMDRRNKGPKSNTIYSWLQAAAGFLEYATEAGIKNEGGLTSDLVNKFLQKQPGYRASLGAFLDYVPKHEQKIFSKNELKPDPVPKQNSSLVLTEEHSSQLIQRLLDPSTDSKEALLGFLMYFYAQTPARVVRLRLSHISTTESGRKAIKFYRMPIALDPDIQAVLDRYLLDRKALSILETEEENVYLFPGRRIGSHMDPSSVGYYLKRWGFDSEQLLATCLFRMFQGGIRHPNVAHHAYGVSKAVCGKYLQQFDSRMSDGVDEHLFRQQRKTREPV